MSNAPSRSPQPETGTPPSRSQARLATRRITYGLVTSVGALLLLVGMALFIPQLSVPGILILIGVLFSLLPGRIRVRTRQLRAFMARLRPPASPSATEYVQPTPRPAVAPPPPLPGAHDALIHGLYRRSDSADGQGPPAPYPPPHRHDHP